MEAALSKDPLAGRHEIIKQEQLKAEKDPRWVHAQLIGHRAMEGLPDGAAGPRGLQKELGMAAEGWVAEKGPCLPAWHFVLRLTQRCACTCRYMHPAMAAAAGEKRRHFSVREWQQMKHTELRWVGGRPRKGAHCRS